MTCPACDGPLGPAAEDAPGRVAVCIWCATPLVTTDAGVRLLTEDDLARLSPPMQGAIVRVANAARLYGAARRN